MEPALKEVLGGLTFRNLVGLVPCKGGFVWAQTLSTFLTCPEWPTPWQQGPPLVLSFVQKKENGVCASESNFPSGNGSFGGSSLVWEGSTR